MFSSVQLSSCLKVNYVFESCHLAKLLLLTKEKFPCQKIVQKLYKMYTKFIQNTKIVHILYTKIVQIKTVYDNEYTKMYIHPISTYTQKM